MKAPGDLFTFVYLLEWRREMWLNHIAVCHKCVVFVFLAFSRHCDVRVNMFGMFWVCVTIYKKDALIRSRQSRPTAVSLTLIPSFFSFTAVWVLSASQYQSQYCWHFSWSSNPQAWSARTPPVFGHDLVSESGSAFRRVPLGEELLLVQFCYSRWSVSVSTVWPVCACRVGLRNSRAGAGGWSR